MTLRSLLAILLALIVLTIPGTAQSEAPTLVPRIVAELSHDTATYTEGLFFHNGFLYESSGGFGKSYLALVQPDTGRILKSVPVPGQYFAEGIAPFGQQIYLLTWKSGVGFIHDINTLQPQIRFQHNKEIKTEGWGLTTDGKSFIRSSGTPQISFHDPSNFSLVRFIHVQDAGKPIQLINELEFIRGSIVANIWKSDILAVINPQTGDVTAWVDISALRNRISPDALSANGIAYDPESGRIFVTGKNWDKLFLVEIEGLSGPESSTKKAVQ